MNIAVPFLVLVLTSGLAFSQSPETTTSIPADNGSNVGNAVNPTQSSILPDLERLETAASQISIDIGQLRIEKWKGGGTAKSAAQANADSVQRNLRSALPSLIVAVRSSPDDLGAEFRLYREMNALCDVVSSLTDAARGFGPKSDYDALAKQSQMLSLVRRNLGESLEQRTASTQQELNQARIQIKTQQEQLAAATKAPPKEIVVAETEPPKKPAPKKKTVSKKPASATRRSNPGSTVPGSSGQTAPGTTPPKS
jgi:hypothetical protein